ncbi:MAG: C40 family peptidase [Sphingomonadales bacterium]|nr:C40 family peptidase [Sphingomonadales bacterium]NCQ21242.1 C40 family peptidase [Sphingomonadales bacterium]NCT04015.1 C40 family peptidase [Sphingomonadales bacterium]
MTATGETLAEAARALIGCPFRLHGRDPATGLDCVGLVSAVLQANGARPAPPSGYALRNLDIAQWLPSARESGLVLSIGPIRAGDVLLIALGHYQHHLAIAADPLCVVHAHAGLRRVVLQPRDPAWQIDVKWRHETQTEG